MAFAALIQGALNERESKIDEQKERMKRNENFMMDTLREAAPRIAAERAKAEEYNDRYQQAYGMTGDDFYAHQYAIDQKLGTDWLFSVRKGQPGQMDLSGQTTQAMGGDPSQQGHANFDQTSGQAPNAGMQQADQTGTALSKVGAMPQLNGQGAPGAPGSTPQPGQQPNQLPNNPMAGITDNTYDPNARMHFRDILFGNIPASVQAHDVLNHVATYTGHTPQEVQQNYNSYMSGDYIFRPSFTHAGAAQAAGATMSGSPSYIPPMDQKDVIREATEIASRLHFDSPEKHQQALQMIIDGLNKRDPSAVSKAVGLTMSDKDYAALNHPARLSTKSITENQFDKDIQSSVGTMLGGKSTSAVKTDADGSQYITTGFDYGNNSALGGAAEQLARQQLTTKYGDKFLTASPDERAHAGHVAVAYMAAEAMAQAQPGSDQYKDYQSVYSNAKRLGHVTDQDMINAASVRANQVVFSPGDQNVLKVLDEAHATNNQELFRSLMQQYPDITTKYMKDIDNKAGAGAAPNKAASQQAPVAPLTKPMTMDEVAGTYFPKKSTPEEKAKNKETRPAGR